MSSYFIDTVRLVSFKLHIREGTEVILLILKAGTGLCMIAGLFHTAEEWESGSGSHLDVDGALTNIRNYREYFYFATITLSTVGYGDISPST